MADKPMHIRDLFSTGQMFTVEAVNSEMEPIEFEVWLRKPTPDAMKEINDKAGAAAARVRAKYRDPDNPRLITLEDEMKSLNRDGVLDFILEAREPELRQQAYNIVLFSEDVGSNWSEADIEKDDGEVIPPKDYLNTVLAAAERLVEIEKFNSELSEEDVHLRIDPEQDEEFVSLDVIQQEFNDEVEGELEKLRQAERNKHKNKTTDSLRKEALKMIIDTDVNIVRYQKIRFEQVLYCTRYPDDKDRRYFKDTDEIESLPTSILEQLLDGVEEVISGPGDIKNLLSLLPS